MVLIDLTKAFSEISLPLGNYVAMIKKQQNLPSIFIFPVSLSNLHQEHQMKKLSLFVSIILSSITLAGCNKTLDFRNAEISNSKIYESGNNIGFSGKLTNIPLNKIPFGDLIPVTNMIGEVTGYKEINDFIYLNTLPGANGGILCDTTTSDGILNGETSCKISSTGNPIFNFSFKNNLIHGDISFFYPKKNSAKFADAHYDQGKANGTLTIYGLKTGKAVYKFDWKNGIATGKEEIFDEETGKVTLTGTLVNGKYEGETTRYNLDGAIVEKQNWENGKLQKKLLPSSAQNATASQDCIDSWIASFRKEQGAEAVIGVEQLNEWESQCSQGEKPQS